MKFVIEHSNTKREIKGQFSICGSREDIVELISQLEQHLGEKEWSYGWTTIKPKVGLVNTHPKSWDE